MAILTSADIAKELRCSKSQISKLLNGKVKGTPPLKSIRVGRSKRIREETFQRWLAEVETCNGDH